MSHRKPWPALGLATAVALSGNAYAQPGDTPRVMTPDAAAATAPAERMSPSADAASTDVKPVKPMYKKHNKKKTPADNDNNAMPNTALSSPPPQPTPQ